MAASRASLRLAIGIPSPVLDFVFFGGCFRKIAQRFSQNAGYLLQIGEVESSLAQLVVGQGGLCQSQPRGQFLLGKAQFLPGLLNSQAEAAVNHT
jgi:hypothetical protein